MQFLCLAISAVLGAWATALHVLADEDTAEHSSVDPQEVFITILRDEQASTDTIMRFVSDVQKVAAVLDEHNPGAPVERIRVISQEIVRQNWMRPEHPFAKDPNKVCKIITNETGHTLNPSCIGGAGERGLFQFLGAKGRYDWNRLKGSSDADIRYQIQCGYNWATANGCGGSEAWLRGQWTGYRLSSW